MQITCFSGFKKEYNSTKVPSSGTTHTVTLKEPTSVLNPVFLLKGNYTSYNYVQWGSRYYYVDDIVIVHNDLVELHCSSDPLATFRSEILASSQLVSRNANTYQPYLADGAYPTLNEAVMDKKAVSTWSTSINSTGYYVVGIVNPDSETGVTYYAFNSAGYKQFLSYMFSDVWLDPNADISLDIQKQLVNPFQYVVSVMWFPFNLSSTGTGHNVSFGFWTPTPIQTANVITDASRVIVMEATDTLPRHPQSTSHGIAMNGSPYSRFAFDCYCFGHIPLDPLPFVSNNGIGFRIEVDLFTGQAILTITNNSGCIVNRLSVQFGVPIQVSQIQQNVVQTSSNFAGALGAFVGGVVTGNVVGGVLGTANGIINGIESLMPQVQQNGAIGSKIAFTQTPLITAQFYKLPALAPQRVGRPLMEQKTLSSLSGFTMCQTVDVELDASPAEKERIESVMKSGFYIE